MTEVKLDTPGGQLSMPVRPAVEGPPGLEVGKLLKETGHVTYDPGFVNTAACASEITFIDGDAGILRYRGYPIDQLAEKSILPRGLLPADLRRAADRRRSSTAFSRADPPAHAAARGPAPVLRRLPARRAPDGRCCPRRSARCRPSTRTASTRSTPSRSRSPRSGCWPRCRRSRRTRTRSRSASRCSTRTTRWATSRTSCA